MTLEEDGSGQKLRKTRASLENGHEMSPTNERTNAWVSNTCCIKTSILHVSVSVKHPSKAEYVLQEVDPHVVPGICIHDENT